MAAEFNDAHQSHALPRRTSPTRIAFVQNAFDIRVPLPRSIYAFPAALDLAVRMLRRTFRADPGSHRGRAALLDDLTTQIRSGAATERQLESTFGARTAEAGFLKVLTPLLAARAHLIAGQVMPFVETGRILDLGCGDALASGMLGGLGEIVLADVMDYRDRSQRAKEFHVIREGRRLPFASATFDTVLLLTVFHHASDPLRLLREAVRVCRGRLIVIESIFGVSASARFCPLPGRWTKLARQPGVQTFVKLGSNEQLAYCSFVDWFYNRILHADVPVPYHYNTPRRWRNLFRAEGLREVGFFHLGLDQPTVPEFHTLHVLEVDSTKKK